MRLLRMAIMAISDAAKKPLAKIKARIQIASSQKYSMVIVASLLIFTVCDQRRKSRACFVELAKNGTRDGQRLAAGVDIDELVGILSPPGKRQVRGVYAFRAFA